jgi:hypothetical protein
MRKIVTIKIECEDWRDIEDTCDLANLCASIDHGYVDARIISIENEEKEE